MKLELLMRHAYYVEMRNVAQGELRIGYFAAMGIDMTQQAPDVR